MKPGSISIVLGLINIIVYILSMFFNIGLGLITFFFLFISTLTGIILALLSKQALYKAIGLVSNIAMLFLSIILPFAIMPLIWSGP
ncbi:hypothetical protein [Bacillus sp. 1P06AnD]|uniref:hypothetical protein n=1 Tax=Bacillus sp. 1P06AnD TaxID=3132208 RepID=UPI0039A0D2B6